MVAAVSLLPHGERRLIDRYQLVGEIASGGMASVYLARLAGVGGFQRFVAIKRLHPHLANDERFIQMFMDEARLAASIHHKNVVPILEIGGNNDGYYLVMEYIEGATVGKMMSRAAATKQALPRPVLLRIVMDVLSGLEAAHQLTGDDGEPLGVVHRDVSPANILVGLDGCTRLTDFGIARAASRLANTREGALKGKLSYMAPEQTQGDDYDSRADIFSVGVVLWEMLAGRRLFRAKSEAATLKRLLQQPIPRLRDKLDISPALDTICATALERDPDKRFQTAAAMVQALEEAARASGDLDTIASERTVAKLMRQRFDADMSEQREALRSWLQATPTLLDRQRQPMPSWSSATGSGPVVVVDEAPPPSSRPPPLPTDTAAAAATGAATATTSTHTGVSLGVSVTPPSVAADVATSLRQPRRRRRQRQWMLAMLLLGVGVAAAVLLSSRATTPPTTHPQLAASNTSAQAAAAPVVSAAAATTTPTVNLATVPAAVATASAASGAVAASVPAPSSSAAASVTVAPRPAPASIRVTPSRPRPRPAPVAPPKPAAGALDDLSNPYR